MEITFLGKVTGKQVVGENEILVAISLPRGSTGFITDEASAKQFEINDTFTFIGSLATDEEKEDVSLKSAAKIVNSKI